MVTIDQAINCIKQQNSTYLFSPVAFDLGSIWIFPTNAEDEADEAPLAVDKSSGKVFAFFPPDYSHETLQRMKEVNISIFLDKQQ